MPKTKQKIYPLELEAQKLLRAIRKYVLYKPKDQMDQLTHSMEFVSWILLTASIIFRMWR